jgi:hypothetical protein
MRPCFGRPPASGQQDAHRAHTSAALPHIRLQRTLCWSNREPLHHLEGNLLPQVKAVALVQRQQRGQRQLAGKPARTYTGRCVPGGQEPRMDRPNTQPARAQVGLASCTLASLLLQGGSAPQQPRAPSTPPRHDSLVADTHAWATAKRHEGMRRRLRRAQPALGRKLAGGRAAAVGGGVVVDAKDGDKQAGTRGHLRGNARAAAASR